MEIIGWAWWAVFGIASRLLALVWFLINGWVSTLLQILVLVGVVYFLRYGWRRAPGEICVRTRSFARFFWSWVRARESNFKEYQARQQTVRVVAVKEFGDINISTLLSLLTLIGLFCASQLLRGN
jgi:hypothetical protein